MQDVITEKLIQQKAKIVLQQSLRRSKTNGYYAGNYRIYINATTMAITSKYTGDVNAVLMD